MVSFLRGVFRLVAEISSLVVFLDGPLTGHSSLEVSTGDGQRFLFFCNLSVCHKVGGFPANPHLVCCFLLDLGAQFYADRVVLVQVKFFLCRADVPFSMGFDDLPLQLRQLMLKRGVFFSQTFSPLVVRVLRYFYGFEPQACICPSDWLALYQDECLLVF